MKQINLLIFLVFTLFTLRAQENKKISGRITSSEGLPVAGATILSKTSKQQTVSNNLGEFLLPKLDINDTLIISHITYVTREIKVSPERAGEILISLESQAKQLGEVTVSTGFQRLPKERATGSFVQIGNKAYNEQVGTNAFDRLKYISNGVVPFPERVGTIAGGQMLIRGLSTLTMSIQKPLIILDNFEYQGDLNNINPNDIENVTFLKDAAAGSIWGAKAANGVIVINTKKGHYDQKTKIELNVNSTFTNKPDLFSIKSISPGDFIDVEKFLFSQAYRFSDTASSIYTPFSPVYEILFKEQNGQITQQQADAQISAWKNTDVRNDFDKYIYQKGVNQQYAINLRGGSQSIAWIISGGFDKNANELNAKYDRVNARMENNYKVTKNLDLFSSVYYTQSRTRSGRPAYGNVNTSVGDIPIYSQLADVSGNGLPLYSKYRQGFIDTFGNGNLLDWKYYPLEDYKHSASTIRLQDINMVVGLNYTLFSPLSIDIKYRYERQKIDNETLFDESSYYNRDLVNNFSQLDWNNGSVAYVIPRGEILDAADFAISAQNLRAQINFNKTWVKHSVNAIGGSELSETINENKTYRTYGYSSENLTYGNVDFANVYPLLIRGSDFIPNPAGFGKTNNRFVSYYVNGAYTYSEKYTISGSARRDASNLFGANTNDKWNLLWSTGLSWDISKEHFYKSSYLPYLKLRITYGFQGNVDPNKSAVTTFRYLGTNPYTLMPYSQTNNFANPDLKWEQTAMTNIGVDFASRNKRISGSLEYFQKKMTDLYGESSIDVTTGIGTNTVTKNVGTMKGYGFDLEINSLNVKGTFSWTTNFIFNSYKDKITKLLPLPEIGNSLVGGGFVGREGFPLFSYFAYKWAGLDPANGDPQGVLDKEVSKDYNAIINQTKSSDLVYVGRMLPSVFGSIGNTISWKNISLTARITYKFGYYFRRQSINYTALVESSRGHSDYSSRWQKPGDENITSVPSFVFPTNSSRDNFYENSEVLATKGDNIRLQYLSMSYSLSRQVVRNLPVENIQLYSVINNIGILWKANKQGLDPDYGNLPPSKSFSIGLRFDF